MTIDSSLFKDEKSMYIFCIERIGRTFRIITNHNNITTVIKQYYCDYPLWQIAEHMIDKLCNTFDYGDLESTIRTIEECPAWVTSIPISTNEEWTGYQTCLNSIGRS